MEITFLGTGTSHGVPSIDCMMQGYHGCPQDVCRDAAQDPRHKRTRSSIMLQWDGKTVVVDIGPDFREQVLREEVKAIDAALFTHCHADHIGGIPDVRSYTREKRLTLYGSTETLLAIKASFPYIFNAIKERGGGIPNVATTEVSEPFILFGKRVEPVHVEHLGLVGCFGYRIDSLCYIPDMKVISVSEVEKIKGVEVLILNCLRHTQHQSHLALSESLALARQIAPRKCYFIHMSHDIHYINDSRYLDSWMHFAYDGLRIEA